jgi:hypothetical protein
MTQAMTPRLIHSIAPLAVVQHPEIAARLEKLMTRARVESADFPLAAKTKKSKQP